MFSRDNNNEELMARQLISNVNELVLTVAKLQAAQENDQISFSRVNEDLKRIQKQVGELKDLTSEIVADHKSLIHLQCEGKDIGHRLEVVERFVSAEKKEKEQRKSEARDIKKSVVTHFLISLLTIAATLIFTAWQMTQPLQPQPQPAQHKNPSRE